MGGTVQEILQRRDRQAGHGLVIRRALLPLLLLTAYAGLLLEYPVRYSVFWFLFSTLITLAYLFLYAFRRQRRYALETFSSAALVIAGAIQFCGHTWLHILYIPYLLTLSMYLGPGTILPVSLAIPLLELRHFITGDGIEEAGVIITTIAGAAVVSAVTSSLRKERDSLKSTLGTLRREAEAVDFVTAPHSVGNESPLSLHLSSVNRANEEIREMLTLAQQSLSADAAHMVSRRDDSWEVRCSSVGSSITALPDERLLTSCVQGRNPVWSGPDASRIQIAAPVMEGNLVAGVLALQTSGSRPFRESDLRTVEMVSKQIGTILQRQRTFAQLHREHLMLRKLKDGGAGLANSLRTDDLAESLIHAVYGMLSIERVSLAFFVPKNEEFELIRQVGFTLQERSVVDARNTRMGLASRSREPDYISDVSHERTPVFPFKARNEGSAYILPLSYERELLGMLVIASPETDAIHPYEIELLKVLGNQASASLVNARLHGEIERLAVTDGLTGLFNHRTFQERLSEKFRELRRFSHALSLMLIDIDFFKRINDTFGHPAGDEILRGVAALIRGAMRDIDIPARYGGEEFAAILIKTDHEGADKLAERLRRSVMAQVFTIDGKEIKVTVSIGIATAPHDARTKEELIARADQALYEAKKRGRNRSVHWKEVHQRAQAAHPNVLP